MVRVEIAGVSLAGGRFRLRNAEQLKTVYV
jgi:hypothetical protein